MQTKLNQRMIERAIRAAHKAGTPPTSAECHPDGRIILCFGQATASPEDTLDREIEQWRSKHAAG